MNPVCRGSLVKTLEPPESFDDWLLGTQYSQKYMAKLRLTTQSSPAPVFKGGRPKNINDLKPKAHRNTQLQVVSREKNATASGDVQSEDTPERYSPNNPASEVRGMRTATKAGIPARRKNGASSRNGGTLSVHGEEPLQDLATRDLLCESYHQMKEAYTGSFPPLLKPYERPFWKYKAVDETNDDHSTHDNVAPQDGLLPTATLVSMHLYDILDVPLNQRPTMARLHYPSGPPSFAPTPSASRWLRSIH
ncbi:hypothetical protein DQ04_04791050 [Trypanosoma grayi]|uniref:hypothetical protein n=1 Tax=Trypanosoma grayi TaxID=71804 RepID=UPI0004F46259|nr:hypothetical protein DQ04_04791050 [Trypanosoma grayi]KEG09702.1 hypothetical protein DQ04_04791050 [Trypanosoma grayi]